VEASDPGWSAYHHDGQRTGVDPTQTTAASINPGSTSPALDGKVYAEPLVDIGHVIVATEGNTVYSVNAGDGTIAWSQNLGPAVVPIGFPCGDINPIGITSTPLIDATNGIVYAVAFLAPLHHELFALNLSTSAVLWHRTVDARAPILGCTTSEGRWCSRRVTSMYPSVAEPGTVGSTSGGSWHRQSTEREPC
jgi:outer membrane protein assembly factor BamB